MASCLHAPRATRSNIEEIEDSACTPFPGAGNVARTGQLTKRVVKPPKSLRRVVPGRADAVRASEPSASALRVERKGLMGQLHRGQERGRRPLVERLEDRVNPVPPLITTFEGIGFDADGAASGFFHTPPTPGVAAGPPPPPALTRPP